jgi:glycopeptide antibiotics resistance protein
VAAASILAILVTALGIELGQVMLPGKIPDTTDWFLESMGGVMGYALASLLRQRLKKIPMKPSRTKHSARRSGASHV